MASSLPVVYEFGSFQLDRDERVLRRGDITIPLTPKATEILLILVERRGHIVEEADLMRQVWPDTAVEESNLTQNIYTLRRVLSDVNGKCRFIETVPRRGYRFVGPVGLLAPETAEAAVDQALAPGRGRNENPPAAVDWLAVVGRAKQRGHVGRNLGAVGGVPGPRLCGRWGWSRRRPPG